MADDGTEKCRQLLAASLARRLEGCRGVQPRQVLESSFYLVTRRCAQRQFLLRPDADTNNAYLYCLIVAALRVGIDVLAMCAMSNHHHVVIFDRYGRYPEFIEHFHKLFARSQNALRGRWENFWAPGQTSVVQLVDPSDVLNKIVYTLTNPVNDDLVERVHHWPGVNGYRALVNGTTLRAFRPRHFFRADGPMPAVVEMQLTVPDELGDRDRFVERVESEVRAIEERAMNERASSGRRVLGRKSVLRQSWTAAPKSFELRRQMSPRIAARNLWSRLEAIVRNKAFVRAYQLARAAWMDGVPTEFPAGTYWLKRFANVRVAC